MFILGGLIVAGIGTISRSQGTSIPQIDSSAIINRIFPKVLMKIDRAEAGINPNPLAGTLLLFIPPEMMMLCFFFKKNKERVKPNLQYPIVGAVLIVLIAEIAAVLYARSFGAELAIITIFLLMGKKRRLFKSVLGMVVILALILIIKSPQYSKNVYITSIREALRNSAVERIPLWTAGVEATRKHPLFGLGLDRFRETPPMVYESAHAHNQFIHIAAEMGIPALIAYLAILIGAGWMTLEVIRSKMPEWIILSMRGLAWGQIGFIIFGIADAIPLGSKPGLFFWISMALMTSIYLYGFENGMIEKMKKNAEATI
jgi:putative inorganic carbon (HCO3(-)) transporter